MELNRSIWPVLFGAGFLFIIPYFIQYYYTGHNSLPIELLLQLLGGLIVIMGIISLEDSSSTFLRKNGRYVEPSVAELVIRGRYEIPYTKVEEVKKRLDEEMNYGMPQPFFWTVIQTGNIIEMSYKLERNNSQGLSDKKLKKQYFATLGKTKGSIVRQIELVLSPEADRMVAEIIAKPVMYYKVTQTDEIRQLKQQVEDVQIEVADKIRNVGVGILGGLEIVQPGPTSQRPPDLFGVEFVAHLPKEVSSCLRDANECFSISLVAPCSVMIRKALENAIRIKFYQMEKQDLMLDSNKQEIGFDDKLDRVSKYIPDMTNDVRTIKSTVKWFGDKGAHDPWTFMNIGDLKDNVAPKARAFLTKLQLR